MKWVRYTKWLPHVQDGYKLPKSLLRNWENHFEAVGIKYRRIDKRYRKDKREAVEILVDDDVEF